MIFLRFPQCLGKRLQSRENDMFRKRIRTYKEIRAAIPDKYFVRSMPSSFYYLGRDVAMVAVFWTLATYIDPTFTKPALQEAITPTGAEVLRWSAWLT